MVNTVIDSVHLNPMDSWKHGEHNNKSLCRVSFAIGAKTYVTCFQVTDDDETIPIVREDELRSLSGVDLRQLHMCISCIMIESHGVNTELIQ